MRNLYNYIVVFLIGIQVMAQPNVHEQVYVHMNSQTLIAGETLQFSAFCNSRLSQKPSPLSKILYVEIIGKNGAIHQQKISLMNGRGSGDFFISSKVPTGQYYLISYTRWMKNFGDYFQTPLLIINPFEEYPEVEPIEKPSIDWYTVDDKLIVGVENTMAFKINAGEVLQFKGRIIDDKGEILASFKPDRFGLGKIDITPKAGVSYQAILEDGAGNLSFHPLPEFQNKGTFLWYNRNEDHLTIKVNAQTRFSEPLDLSVYLYGELLHRAKFNAENEYELELGDIAHGLLEIEITSQSGEKLARRKVLHGQKDAGKETNVGTFGTRQKVEIPISLPDGSYSVSVRKLIDTDLDAHAHAQIFQWLNESVKSPVALISYLDQMDGDLEIAALISNEKRKDEIDLLIKWLPEIREEILTGFICDSLGKPITSKQIALAFPGDPYHLRIGESDENGSFVIPFNSSRQDHESILTTLDFDESVSIKVDNPFLDEYPDFDYSLPDLDSTQITRLVKRSVRNQLLNAYYIPKVTEPIANTWSMEFPYTDEYYLDEYTRFKTLKETFTEYVVQANVRSKRDPVIKTTYFPGLGVKANAPLVLLDGVPVEGSRVIDYNPYEIESIKVINNQYYLGSLIVDGVIDLSTKNKKLENFRLGEHYHMHLITALNQPKQYSFPDYSRVNDKYIPDQRDQLYWNPAFKDECLLFYTSDVTGRFEIVIEGFTEKGEPVSRSMDFDVK